MCHPYRRSRLLLEVLVRPRRRGVTHVSVSLGQSPGTQQGKERRCSGCEACRESLSYCREESSRGGLSVCPHPSSSLVLQPEGFFSSVLS